MMPLVSGTPSHEPLDVDLAELGVREYAVLLLIGQPATQLQIHSAQGDVGIERGQRRNRRLGRHPVVLFEWLHDVVVFGQGVTQARREDHLDVREMDEELPRGPLPRRIRLLVTLTWPCPD